MAESADERLPFENLSIRNSHSNYTEYGCYNVHVAFLPTLVPRQSRICSLDMFFPLLSQLGLFRENKIPRRFSLN